MMINSFFIFLPFCFFSDFQEVQGLSTNIYYLNLMLSRKLSCLSCLVKDSIKKVRRDQVLKHIWEIIMTLQMCHICQFVATSKQELKLFHFMFKYSMWTWHWTVSLKSLVVRTVLLQCMFNFAKVEIFKVRKKWKYNCFKEKKWQLMDSRPPVSLFPGDIRWGLNKGTRQWALRPRWHGH